MYFKLKPREWYLELMIVSLLFSGFLTNFLSPESFSVGTILFDGLLILLIFDCICRWDPFAFSWSRQCILICAMFLILLAGVLIVAMTAFTSLYDIVVGIRHHILYYSIPIFIYLFALRADRSSVLNFLIVSSLLVNCYAIFQFLFRSILPDAFLYLRNSAVFAIGGLTSYRVTGLVGDMIVMGGLAIITLMILMADYFCREDSIVKLWMFLIPIAANLLTFSRTSIAGMAGLAVLAFLMLSDQKRSVKIALLVILVIVGLILLFTSSLGAALIARFFSSDVNSESNAIHFATYQDAIDALKENFLFGIGLGTQLTSLQDAAYRIIDDGYWWSCALELGIPLFIFKLVYCLYTIYVMFRAWRRGACSQTGRALCFAYVFSALYFLMAGVLNNAFIKTNLCLMFILFGLALAEIRQTEAAGLKDGKSTQYR